MPSTKGRLMLLSVAQGLIPDKPIACAHAADPTAWELEMAGRKHRWAKMRKIHADCFNDIFEVIETFEQRLIEALDLPPLDVLRTDAIGEPVDGYDRVFVYDRSAQKAYDAAVLGLEEKILGTQKLAETQAVDPLSMFAQYMFMAYTLGIEKTVDSLKKNKLPDMTDDEIDALRLLVQSDNVYFRAAYDAGADRIRAELQSSWREGFHNTLLEMARGEKSILEAGRAMRKQVGEGKMWYWNRIARSESTLMVNEAFNLQSRAANANYEEWSGAPGMCDICLQFDGRTWKLGEGPQPVSHTHPHCLCIRIPKWETDATIQDKWERETPYDAPYSKDERDGGLI
jgi:hypothetical protein